VSKLQADFERRIVVVDDEPIIRTLIASKFQELGFEAWSAADAIEAKKLVKAKDPDALVVDLDLGPGPTGIELITSLNAINPSLGFVLLTNFAPAAWELKAAKNLKFVKKSEVHDFAVLVSALEEALHGRYGFATESSDSGAGPVAKLTKKQLVVLSKLAQGKTNQEISSDLEVSLGAVEQTIKRIYITLGLEGRARASRRVAAARLYSRTMGPGRAD
jgi:DNA-binding NarL/FixJ family response regulator